MNGKLWYLKQCDLFEKLTPVQAERLDRHASVLTFKRRALIYSPAEPGLSVLVLARGRIKIKDLTPDGKETILAFIEEGEIFGELAVLDGQARGEFAEAVTDAQVLVIPREDLLWLLELRPDVALSITKLVGLRRRRIENRFRNVLFLSSRERMVRLLLELVAFHGERQGNRCQIRLPLSHQDLASLIGVTRETVTHVLGQLQVDGLIQARRRHLTVLDCERLAEESAGAANRFRVEAPRQTPLPKARGV
ncbi:MAG: Crp/Fnr family transcriptional regulator [Gemmataceae bacterium]|nr:Crp/Fnr family transcriptional regulator [Gemmataceae bacterium]